MNCDFLEIEPGIFQCQRPACGIQNRFPLREMPKSNCRAFTADGSPDPNIASIQANGPKRTDNEVLVIITNFCEFCPAWNPTAEKKKCKYCGCGSSDTVENLHKRRIRNCPKGHWTEASLQRYLHSEATPDPLAPAKSEPKPEPCTVCGKPSTTICGYTSFLMCGAPLCDTCTHPHWL